MGLESHITRTLQHEKSGFAEGWEYWFEDGLHTDNEANAAEISRILDESGEFGPTRIVKVPTPGYIKSRKETWKVEFGCHSQWFDHKKIDYKEYCKRFKEFREEKNG